MPPKTAVSHAPWKCWAVLASFGPPKTAVERITSSLAAVFGIERPVQPGDDHDAGEDDRGRPDVDPHDRQSEQQAREVHHAAGPAQVRLDGMRGCGGTHDPPTFLG
jgi:hypothetical protein